MKKEEIKDIVEYIYMMFVSLIIVSVQFIGKIIVAIVYYTFMSPWIISSQLKNLFKNKRI